MRLYSAGSMQVIRTMAMSADRYLETSFQEGITAPPACPQCGVASTLRALGYYSRNITGSKNRVLRILIRRFRCRNCHRTVSILPSFAQPYRLVENHTINEFFGGSLAAGKLSWLPLLKQYWKRFSDWLPRLQATVALTVSRAPPSPDPGTWWKLIAETFGDIEQITHILVGQFRVTLFGCYRCHSPCGINQSG